MRPYEDFSKVCLEAGNTKPFTEGLFHRFRNRFGWKNMETTGEATSASEEAVATF
jgi:hypothetical protein